MVQEARANVAKHARAAGVSAALDAIVKGRLGLVGMRGRAALVGGELKVESGPGEGTTVLIRIPLPDVGGT